MKLFRIVSVSASVIFLAISCSGPLGGNTTFSAGVVKTTNGGADWTANNTVLTGKFGTGKNKNVEKTSTALAGTDVLTLAFENTNTEHVFAGTSTDGVYVSENSGDAWRQILSKISVRSLVVDPKSGDHIYVAGIAAGNGKVLETKDKGKSWLEVYNEASKQNPVNAIALNPSNPSEVVIGLNSGNVVRSTDGGKSWVLVQNLQDPIVQIVWQGSGLYILAQTKGLYRSANGSAAFTNMSQGLADFTKNNRDTSGDSTKIEDTTIPQTSVQKYEQFAVSTKNPNLLYVAADNGLYKTIDAGTKWSYVRLPLKNSGNGIPITSVSLGNVDTVVYTGAGSTVYKSLNGADTWQVQSIATSSTIQYILVDPHLSQVAYIGLNGGHK